MGLTCLSRKHPHSLPQPDIVIPTHLHFYHAGGCVRLVAVRLTPAFLDAFYYFREDELTHAKFFHSKTRPSYLWEAVDGVEALLEAGRVKRIGGGGLTHLASYNSLY